MKYNLLEEQWIPVRRASGTIEHIRPAQVALQDENDPIISFAATRPDFNAALMEFMIGLLQTCAMPEDDDAWYDWYVDPPSSQTLQNAFTVYADAFNLIGDGPKFLQDYSELNTKTTEIAALLIDTPGDKTVRLNKDHFIKSRRGLRLKPQAVALALFTLQSMAPSGGAGHRTSMRGGGPWITLAIADTLWKSLWANVIDEDRFTTAYSKSLTHLSDPEKIFPWLAATQTSEKTTGRPVQPDDGSPLQAYWGMPRRIRLLPRIEEEETNTTVYFEQYQTKNYGIEYSGQWIHPLTPYRFNQKGEPNPVKGTQNTLSFKNWSHYAFGDNGPNKSALNIHTLQHRLNEFDEIAHDFQLLSCGYDMDSMKARCWYEGLMPLLKVPNQLQSTLVHQCTQLTKSFDEISTSLHHQIRKALFGRYKESPETGKRTWGKIDLPSAGNIRLKNQSVEHLESVATQLFYSTIERLIEANQAEEDPMSLIDDAKLTWLEALGKAAREYFDQTIQPQSAAADHVSITRARQELRMGTASSNKKLRTTLGLPPLKKRAAS